MKHDGWTVPAGFGAAVEDSQLDLLRAYAGLLADPGERLGVIGPGDRDRVWERHVLDGLRGCALVVESARSAYDLGSGSGIPGVPVAIGAPQLSVTLVEPRRQRVAFLELVIERLGLTTVRIDASAAASLEPGVDLCLARAFAPPAETWATADRLLAPGGSLLMWVGGNFELARDAPPGSRCELFTTPALASSGPIAMMTRL